MYCRFSAGRFARRSSAAFWSALSSFLVLKNFQHGKGIFYRHIEGQSMGRGNDKPSAALKYFNYPDYFFLYLMGF